MKGHLAPDMISALINLAQNGIFVNFNSEMARLRNGRALVLQHTYCGAITRAKLLKHITAVVST